MKTRRSPELERAEQERREFLKKFGRFAAATPPLITAILCTPALADDWQSGGHKHCQHHKCKGGGGEGGGGDGEGGGGGWGGGKGW